jgi:hypothetical protein
MRRMFVLVGVAAVAVCALALPASAASITVSPTSTATSGTVTVSGDVLVNGTRTCAVGDDVTLISNAFAGHGEFAGEGAVTVAVDSTGHFTTTVTLDASVAPGTYTVTGRCGGGNLGVEASLTVTGLPRTGASFGPFTTAQAIALCGALCAVGLALTSTGRRRARCAAVVATTRRR